MRKVILCVLVMLACVAHAQTKRALVIGIGEYPKESGWKRVNGDRDADSVRKMLSTAGFTDVKCLKNSQATKANIVNAFKGVAERCKKGDVVYVHFSGHGQQMKDNEGDEADGLDEAWIPYDACEKPCSKDSGEKHLVDDEIGVLLDAIYAKVGAEGKILVVVDACHSGSSTRTDDDEDVVCRGTTKVFVTANRKKQTRVKEHWMVISACDDKQSNAELKRPSMGKLTYAICWMMKNGCKDDNRTMMRRIQLFYDKNRSPLGEQTVVFGGGQNQFEISQMLVKQK